MSAVTRADDLARLAGTNPDTIARQGLAARTPAQWRSASYAATLLELDGTVTTVHGPDGLTGHTLRELLTLTRPAGINPRPPAPAPIGSGPLPGSEDA